MTTTTPEGIMIGRCLAAIEKKLGWGDAANWSKGDFEKLSEIIQEKTGVTLSLTTLKRIWGKVKYDNNPTVTTLNTLAQFLGHENWRSFMQQEKEWVKEPDPIIEPAQNTVLPKKRLAKPAVFGSALLLIALVIFLLFNNSSKVASIPANAEPVIDTSKFSFRLNKMIAEGVPNSVIFNYDASAARTDSVFIVQTWDISRKVLVPKNKNEYSAIYYYPGYFRTKLIAENQIVKEKDLMVRSDGWMALIEQSPIPVYFDKKEFLKNGIAEITAQNILAHNFSMEPQAPKVRFFNIRDLGELYNDNFHFETTIKSDFHKGSAVCQNVQVLIQCKDDIIIIPLSAKACVGNLQLYFAGKGVTSKDADLSKFGCDLSKWTKLCVEAKHKKVQVYLNNQLAYSLTFPHSPTAIVGFQYRFEGTGAIRDTWIANDSIKHQF